MRTLIYPEWLIDGTGADALGGYALAFGESGRIEAVAPASQLAEAAADSVVRAPGMTLLPGLINMHVHLSLASDNAPFIPYMDAHSDVALGLRAAHSAAASLQAGVTTLRDCGSRGRSVLDLRAARAEGLLHIPRVLAAGHALTISGGHMRPFGGEVDGVDGVCRMVRQLVSNGADFIKMAGSGGGTPGSLTDYPSFSIAEFQAAVETAHGLGRRVTVHCTAAAAIERAVSAGVDSIEHGYFGAPGNFQAYDARLADQLAQQRVSVTPTLQVFRDMAELLPAGAERDFWQSRREILVTNVGRLHAAGVQLTAGSDAGWRFTRFDNYARELEEMASAGLSALEVVHAATGAASQAIGREAEFGTLRPGLSADLVLVDGNLAEDIRHVGSVRRVYVEGELMASPTPSPSGRGQG
ncbi:MAG: amidohydrolase family protein [Chloroflexi bacterium]|nr:amidohydrolase family protein [Chloroflexota bacterium]